MKAKPVQAILVVDNYIGVCEVLRLSLSKYGFHVETATSGAAAIRKVEKLGATLDLVVLDLHMPRMDGEQTLLRIRALQADLPCLIYSGFVTDAAIARMEHMGRCAFLAKPASLPAVLEQVEQLLARYPRTKRA